MDIQDEVYLKAKQRLNDKELTEDAYLLVTTFNVVTREFR